MTNVNSILDELLADMDKLGRIEVIKRLHNLYLESDNKNTRVRILEILNQLKDNTHYEESENYFLSDVDPDVRIEAAKLLAFNYSEKKAIKPLIWVLENDRKEELKNSALNLLVAFAYREEFKSLIVESLKKTLMSSNNKMKMDVIEALGIIKEQSAVNDLIEMLDSSNKLVRIRAIQALGNIKNEKAVPRLIDNLSLESSDIWKFAFEALRKMLNIETLIKSLKKKLKVTDQLEHDFESKLFKHGIIKALHELGEKKEVKLKNYSDILDEFF